MGLEFGPVDESDFFKIREKPEFMKIEEALVQIGGGGVEGVAFKKELVKICGWKYPDLTSYGKYPKVAAEAFCKLREALRKTSDKDELRKLLAA